PLNAASTPGCRRLSERAAPIAKCFHHQWVKTEFCQRVAGARIVERAAGEPVAAEAVRQRGQERALAEPPRPLLQVLRQEPVAADGYDAGRRRGDVDRAGHAV